MLLSIMGGGFAGPRGRVCFTPPQKKVLTAAGRREERGETLLLLNRPPPRVDEFNLHMERLRRGCGSGGACNTSNRICLQRLVAEVHFDLWCGKINGAIGPKWTPFASQARF